MVHCVDHERLLIMGCEAVRIFPCPSLMVNVVDESRTHKHRAHMYLEFGKSPYKNRLGLGLILLFLFLYTSAFKKAILLLSFQV
jgi:hypothetical protein